MGVLGVLFSPFLRKITGFNMNTYTGKGEKNMENFRNNLFKVTILLLLIN
jgi:hypothetical protein